MNGFATCEAIFKAFQNTILKKGLWSLSTAALDYWLGGICRFFHGVLQCVEIGACDLFRIRFMILWNAQSMMMIPRIWRPGHCRTFSPYFNLLVPTRKIRVIYETMASFLSWYFDPNMRLSLGPKTHLTSPLQIQARCCRRTDRARNTTPASC